MKLIFSVIFTIFNFNLVFAQHYMIGDTLYVVALSGLKLREAADSNGPVNNVLKNGEQVVIKETDQLVEDNIEGFNGHWVKIQSLSSSIEGYVFDAFISRYPVLKKYESIQGYIADNWKDHDLYGFLPKMLEEYTLKIFNPEGCHVSYSNGSDGEGNYSIEIMQLNHKAKFIKYGDSEGSGTELELTNPRISEVYYLIKNIVKFIPQEILTLDEDTMKVEREYGQVYVKVGEYSFVIRIAYKGNNVVSIIFFNACC